MEHTVKVASAELGLSSTGKGVFSQNPVCTLIIPNSLLLHLHKDRPAGYTAGVNKCIKEGIVTLDTSCDRLESSLRRLAGKVVSKHANCKGSSHRKKVREGQTLLLVGEGETVSVTRVAEDLQERVQTVTLERDEMRVHFEQEKAAKEEERQNSALRGALKASENKGKKLDEVGERQKRRKIAQLQMFTESTLQPCMATYGLKPTSVMAVTDAGTPVTLPLASGPSSSPQPAVVPVDHSQRVLYLLDRYGVSDEFYHELAQTVPELPRLHHVKKVRSQLNSGIDHHRLPEPYKGTYLPFREMVTKTLAKTLEQAPRPHNNKVTVKLSGDGARFSSQASYVFLTFSFPGLATDVLSASGNHTYAAAKGGESYTFLQQCFQPVWDEVREVMSNPTVTIDSHLYYIKFVFAADYKFLLLLMGMNKASSTYACLWCTTSSDERWDMAVPEEKCTSLPPHGKARTLQALQDNCMHAKKGCKHHLGSINPPILPIRPTDLVLDELHALLRISDVLLRNLIFLVDTMEHRARLRTGTADITMQHLEDRIKSCGVSFTIRQAQDENGKSVPGKFEWTALDRQQRLKVLHKLPPTLQDLFCPEDARQISKLWMDFVCLYKILSSDSPNADQLHEKAKTWVTDFLSLGRHEGYQKRHVTPYMHAVVYHVPSMIRQHGNLLMFSGQGVEKNNDTAKKNFYSSNRHDPCAEVIMCEQRLEALQECRRQKRAYNKKDESYWSTGIFSKRARAE